jgi:hypothetical protein
MPIVFVYFDQKMVARALLFQGEGAVMMALPLGL